MVTQGRTRQGRNIATQPEYPYMLTPMCNPVTDARVAKYINLQKTIATLYPVYMPNKIWSQIGLT